MQDVVAEFTLQCSFTLLGVIKIHLLFPAAVTVLLPLYQRGIEGDLKVLMNISCLARL